MDVAGVGPEGRFVTVGSPNNGELRLYEVKLGTGGHPSLSTGSRWPASRERPVHSLRDWRSSPRSWFWWLRYSSGSLSVGRATGDRVRRKAADISVTNLNDRIANPGTGDELEHLVTTLNALLSRLESALDRERRLVADASHEFRSPLAAIRANLEVEMAAAREPSDTQRAVLRGVLRLQDLADELLVLEQTQRSDSATPGLVDLDELVLLRSSTSPEPERS